MVFSSFSYYLFQMSVGNATSVITVDFCFLSGWLAIFVCLSVWRKKSNGILAILFLAIFWGISYLESSHEPSSNITSRHIPIDNATWIIPFSSCLHVISYYYVLDSFWRLFAQFATWILSNVVDHCFDGPIFVLLRSILSFSSIFSNRW